MFDSVVGDAFGIIGEQGREGVERAGCLSDGTHLEPVAEQHHHDQRRELPPEVEVADTQCRGPG